MQEELVAIITDYHQKSPLSTEKHFLILQAVASPISA